MHRPGLEDAPRLDSQCDRMLARLKKGAATNTQLVEIALNYRARISELRQMGHNVQCEKKQGGLAVYRLVPKRDTPVIQLEMFG